MPPCVVWGVFLIEQASKNNPESKTAAEQRHMEAIKTAGKSPATTRTKATHTSHQTWFKDSIVFFYCVWVFRESSVTPAIPPDWFRLPVITVYGLDK